MHIIAPVIVILALVMGLFLVGPVKVAMLLAGGAMYGVLLSVLLIGKLFALAFRQTTKPGS